jgi:hypothetical protein
MARCMWWSCGCCFLHRQHNVSSANYNPLFSFHWVHMCIWEKIILCSNNEHNIFVAGSRQLLEAARASTTLDEGKFKVKFCILKLCLVDRATFARASTTYEDCYCCMNGEPPLLCYDTMDICQAICPTCNPRCPDAFVGPTERNWLILPYTIRVWLVRKFFWLWLL